MQQDEFFDKNSNFYGALSPKKYDYFFLNFIKKYGDNCSILDIGGGGGCFTRLCKESLKNVNVCVVDPSPKLLQKQNLDGINLVVGKLPDELNITEKFDYIHLKEVLHHVTGSSIDETKNLLKSSLVNSVKHLDDDGYLLIHELFYESYLIPTFTRTTIFYLLNLQNSLNFTLPSRHFLKGLSVCFYTRDELQSVFNDIGLEVVDYYEEKWNDTQMKNLKKISFIKNWGRMVFVLRRPIK